MADKSAFGVYSKPNFFELFLRDRLDEGLYDAFKFVIKTLSAHYPDNALLSRIKRHRTSLYYALLSLFEAYTLTHHSSTLSERFLGITRVSTRGHASLTRADVLLSLTIAIGAPLLKRHLRKTAKRYSSGDYFTEDDEHGDSLPARYARIITTLHPYLQLSTGLASLTYAVAYIGGLTHHTGPLQHLAGLRPAAARPCTGAERSPGVLGALGRGVGDALRLLLPLVAFGYRSLEWWYSIPASVAAGEGQQGSLPPAPEPPKLCGGVTLPPVERCPLCGRKRTNPAVIASSGFAFCYPCVVKYVREYGRCPVTGVPADETQIRRLFVK